jgi:hypothetical protein
MALLLADFFMFLLVGGRVGSLGTATCSREPFVFGILESDPSALCLDVDDMALLLADFFTLVVFFTFKSVGSTVGNLGESFVFGVKVGGVSNTIGLEVEGVWTKAPMFCFGGLLTEPALFSIEADDPTKVTMFMSGL